MTWERKHTMARAKFEILLVGDSRITDMERRLKNHVVRHNMKDINISVRAHPGKTISGILDETIKEFKNKKFDLLYFSGGTNDLSTKIGWRIIEPIFHDETTLKSHILELMEGAKGKLSVIALKVILCDLVGFSYKDYNITGKEYPDQQRIINNSMIAINSAIDVLNSAENLIGVKWGFHVHKLRHGRRGHRYSNTMADGLHFTDDTKDKFARYIAETFYANIHITCN